MRRIVFSALVISASTSLADKNSLVAHDPLNLCRSGYQAIARSAKATAPTFLASLRKELPQIRDPENFATLYRQRLAAWKAANPRRRSINVPMPENKPAVDWLKTTLLELKNNPYYRYPDEATRLLTEGPRRLQTAKLLREIRRIERTGYGTRDIAAISSDVFEFLKRIDPPSLYLDEVLNHIDENFMTTVEIPKLAREKLSSLRFAAGKEMAVGERALELNKEYERALIETIKDNLPVGAGSIDVEDIVRRYKFQRGFAADPEENFVVGGLSGPLYGEQPIIFATGETSVRTLAEASLFDIKIAGLINQPIRADGTVMDPARFLEHDFSHMAGTYSDLISKKILGWSAEKKKELLAQIDAISDPRKKEISEYTLLVALREFPSSNAPLFNPKYPAAHWWRVIQDNFKMLGDANLTDDEAQTAIQWWKANLPLQ